MKASEIVTGVIAVYGAVLSTIAILRQWRGDKVKVRLTVNRDRVIVGDPRYEGALLTEIRVTNIGRRPVTVVGFGAMALYPNRNLSCVDSQPQLPREITEGQFIVSYWDQDDLDFSAIDYWVARDSHDRTYKLREASWWKHWKSVRQQKRDWRRKKKT